MGTAGNGPGSLPPLGKMAAVAAAQARRLTLLLHTAVMREEDVRWQYRLSAACRLGL